MAGLGPGNPSQPALGLRERKKAKTRAAIQQHALRLFREQGYDAITVEQIAEAAEVSSNTFFRYFPTKDDVVLYDAVDPLIFAAFVAQPAEVGPLQALRGALQAVFATLPVTEMAEQRERAALMVAVPELRMRMLDQLADATQYLAELVAGRVGRRADDLAVRTFAGAVIGAMMGPLLAAAADPAADYLAVMDASLAYLEAGLPL